MSKELKNEIVQLDTGDYKLDLNNEFQEVLAQIPTIVQESKDILAIDIDDLDDAKINEVDKKLRSITSFNRKIENGRKDLRSYLNNYRDSITAVFDQRLSQSGYDQVPDLASQVRQRKNDIKAHRINQRWDDLKSTFNDNTKLYQDMFNKYPQLANFSNFKLHHDDLVSGAKSKKITAKTRGLINNEIGQWSNLLNTIEENQWGLNATNLNNLIQSFVQNPTKYAMDSMQLLNNASFMKDEQDKQIAYQEELKRQQELAKQSATHTVDNQPTPNNFQPKVEPKAQAVEYHSEFEVVDDLIASNPRYRGISGNSKLKCRFMFDYFHNMQANNPIYQAVGNDADKTLRLMQHIMDL